jgi:hypothetical protein
MLEETLKQVSNNFLTYGLVGALALVEFYIIVKLYNRNQELHNTLFEFGQKVVESQTKTASALSELQNAIMFRRGSKE